MIRHLLLIIALFTTIHISGQTREYATMHSGVRAFNKGDIASAKKYFDRAAKANPNSARAMFALGNVALQQEDDSLALAYFVASSDHETNKYVKALSFHNIGCVHYAEAYQGSVAIDSISAPQEQQELYTATIAACEKAIEAYKEALRNNPRDEDTRYNLALAQKLLKDLQQDAPQPDNQNNEDPNDSNSGDNNQNDDNSQDQDNNQSPEGKNNNDRQQQPPQKEEDNYEQLLELARQAEEQTRQRMQQAQAQSSSQRHLKKNW